MSAEKKRGGRPLKYNDDFPGIAEAKARQGLNDKQIAAALGISFQVFYEYQKRFPEFKEAVARGKKPVDHEVENALLRRCLGFSVDEKFVETDGNGKVVKQRVTRKEILPDVDAIKFWLSRRKRREWGNEPDAPPPPADDGEDFQKALKLLESMSYEDRVKELERLMGAEYGSQK